MEQERSRGPVRRKLWYAILLLVLFSFVSKPALAQETVFGPEELKISWSRLHISFHKFMVGEPGEGTISIGKNIDEKRIRGGFARLNGKWIPLQSFLRGDTTVFEKSVHLQSRNHLFVFLSGDRGASIDLEVRKKISTPPPEINFSAFPMAIKLGESSELDWDVANAETIEIEPGIGTVKESGSLTVSPSETTTYILRAAGKGGTATRGITLTVYQPPTVTFSADPEMVTFGQSTMLSWSSTNADKVVIDQNIGEVNKAGSLEVKPDCTTTYTINASGPGGSAQVQVVVTVKANVEPQPEGSFGKRYEDLIPPDATIEAYDSGRFSVVTGLVHDVDGLPLVDASITIHNSPEYGTAFTDGEGRFSIPAEGGGTITVVYEKEGLIAAHRKVYVPWNDIAIAETIQMVEEDSAATTIAFDGNPDSVFTHQSTEVSDEFGTRSCTMIFTGDNRAYEVDSQGTVIRELAEITTRATEFTTPESMPAILPPTSVYTYCTELSVDGAERVTFAQPVVMWVDNFLGFQVGEVVPVGSYDRDRSVWVPERNGLVVQLLDVNSDGLVDALDADGDTLADDLDGDGSYSDEVKGLNSGESYQPGSTFWRAEIEHFSPIDLNWPVVLPAGAILPNATRTPIANQQKEEGKDCQNTTSSFVEERSGIFHEDIAIPGTDLTLHYASNAVEGYSTIITVPASKETVSDILRRIIVRLEVAGRVFEKTFDGPAGNLTDRTAEFVWDGRDHLGREVDGLLHARARVGFVYGTVYASATSFTNGFGLPGEGATTIPARVERTLWKYSNLDIQVRKNDTKTVAKGWSISNRHWLSPVEPTILYKGDGTVLKNAARIIDTFAGKGKWGFGGDGGPAIEAELAGVNSLTLDAAGNLYITGYFGNSIRKVDPKGIMATVAGTGQAGFSGDGGPATLARVNGPRGTTVDRESNIYFADYYNHRIRKVDKTGIITTIAGTGQPGFSGDGGPATQARLNWPAAVAQDDKGNLYIVDNHRIRKIDPGGIITTVAGNGRCTSKVTEGPALQASLCYPDDVEVDSAGNLYIADNGNSVVRKVDTSGMISTLAGNPNCSVYSGGNGVPATKACLYNVLGIYVDSARNVYLADSWNYCVRKVDNNGMINTVAGTCGEERWGDSGDGGPATKAKMGWTWDVEGDSSGNLYIADHDHLVVRKVVPAFAFIKAASGDEIAFADANGLGYIMSKGGNHKKTIDLDTGALLYEFDYNEEGYLVSFIDRFGNQTSIERDGAGCPTAIVPPDGIRTGLTVDSGGKLTRIIYPDGSFYSFAYTADGLMTTKIEPEGNRFAHGFDSTGRLITATDEEGGNWQYSRTTLVSGDILTQVITAEGEETSYRDSTDLTGAYLSTITGPTGAQTLYRESADGARVKKDLPCGTELHFAYDLDPEYKFRFVSEMRERKTLGLEKISLRAKNYQDNDGDDVPDVITETVTVNGRTTTLEKNVPQARKILTSPAGRTLTAHYDHGNLRTTRLVIPGLHDTVYGYDTRGRLTSVTTNSRQTTLSYDMRGNLESITDPENQTTNYAYDAVGRMTGIGRPDGSSVGFSYDKNGNMTVVTNPANISHGFGYNKINRNNSYLAPLSGIYSYNYDKDRRLTQITFPSGRQITNLYANGMLEEVLTAEGNVDFTYLCGSKVDTVTKGGEGISFDYDGSLVTAENLTGTLNTFLGYGYNNDFNLKSFTYAGGTVGYGYDDDGLLTRAGDFVISRNKGNGLPESVTAGALSLSRTFNGYGEVKGQNSSVGGLAVHSWDLSRNDSGRVVAKIETVDGMTAHYRYTYDPTGRLLTVTKDGNLSEEYRYDNVGTRVYEMNVSRGIAARSMTYDDEDRLLTAGGAVYQYDADGFLAAKAVGTEENTYNYSSRGELLSVTLSDETEIEYLHDPLGRRIAKKVNGTVTEKYFWQGLTRLLAVYDGSDNLVTRFLYADARMPLAMEKGSAVYYLSYDQVGSLRVVADVSGNVVKRIDYDSFGNITNDTNALFEIPFGFAGGLQDKDTGLIRFGFRDYDPDTGRWTAKDPVGFWGGQIDFYGYCLNDPFNWIDPFGFSAVGDVYVGIVTAVTEGTKGAAYSLAHASKDITQLAVRGDPYVKTALGIVLVSEVVPFACAGAMAAGPVTSATVAANAADFFHGAIVPGPPPATPAGYSGFIVRELLDRISQP